MVEVFGVTFKDKGRIYYFSAKNFQLKKNITVVVETERGIQFGKVATDIQTAPERTKASMNNFVYTVGLSYQPLHQEALQIAQTIGTIEVNRPNKKPLVLNAYESIQKEIEKDRIGFKRKYVRC